MSHALLDVERAALLYPDHRETFAILERVFANFLERAGKRNFLEPTALKTTPSDVLNAVRDLDVFEIVATIECIFSDFLQGRR